MVREAPAFLLSRRLAEAGVERFVRGRRVFISFEPENLVKLHGLCLEALRSKVLTSNRAFESLIVMPTHEEIRKGIVGGQHAELFNRMKGPLGLLLKSYGIGAREVKFAHEGSESGHFIVVREVERNK